MTVTTKKISTKIWQKVIAKLDTKLEAACLRRDAYLNKVLANELNYLDSEVSIPNSKAAHDFIAKQLDNMDRKLVSLTLQGDIVERLNEICSRKRIVRDAFFNRLFLLLAASPKLIDRLIFPGEPEWRTEVWSEHGHDETFFQNGFYPLEQLIDPFWSIRAGIEIFSDDDSLSSYIEPESGREIQVRRTFGGQAIPRDSLYAAKWGKNILKDIDLCGLNTFIPDSDVPGHPAQLAEQQELDDLLEGF